MFSYLYCTFPVCILEFPAMYLRVYPLLILNYSKIFFKNMEFLNGQRTLFEQLRVVVTAQIVKKMAMDSNPDVKEDHEVESCKH